jgi:hypothetical protein
MIVDFTPAPTVASLGRSHHGCNSATVRAAGADVAQVRPSASIEPNGIATRAKKTFVLGRDRMTLPEL